ncbi:hypothetical protein [Enterococcus sp. AZ196]|uniref:hypothetical protein n=1 Tax=Enterococcus sp. AZ196 TaxID=2774659 RepID=UPI003D2BDA39
MDNPNSLECKKAKRIIEQNTIPNILKNSWWKREHEDWNLNAGKVMFKEDEEGYPNLFVDSTFSSQVCQRIILKPNHRYFVKFDVQVTRYVKGLFGIHFNGGFKSENTSFGLRRLSKGFETLTYVLDTSEKKTGTQLIFVGSIHGADGAGSIRRLSLYDLTDLYGEGKEPEADEFNKVLPDLQDDRGSYLTLRETFSQLDYKININSPGTSVDDGVAFNVFLEEMKKKANLIGMKNTSLKNVNGFKQVGHLSTSRDILKLALHATGYEKLLPIWGKKEHKTFIHGENAREIEVTATVQDDTFEEFYTLLGGKSGAILNEVLNSVALIKDDEGELYLASVMGSSGPTGKTDRYEAMKLLVDIARERKINPDYHSTETYKAKSGSIILLPKGNPHFYTHCPPKSIYSINENQLIPPASMTKLINALVVLDNIQNLHETFEITQFDIIGGSGPLLHKGDIISFWDAFHFLFLPSSNTIAKAFSRVVGNKIVQA